MSITRQPLSMRVGELAGSSAFLLYLSDASTQGLSVSQAAFFMLAAAADARGTPMTRNQLLSVYGEQMAAATHNIYRVFMPPSRAYPNGMGWLDRQPNPNDEREKFLVLTDKGRRVVEAALLALAPLAKANA